VGTPGIAAARVQAGRAECAQLARLHQALDRGNGLDGEGDLAVDHVGDRLRAALVRHVHHLDARHRVEQHRHQVAGRSRARGRERILARLGLERSISSFTSFAGIEGFTRA